VHRRAANACRWASTQAGHHLICGQSFRHPAIIVIRVSDNAQERVRWDTRSRIDAAVTPTASYWASLVATDTGVHHTLEFLNGSRFELISDQRAPSEWSDDSGGECDSDEDDQ
jgi:hypothetical protein